MSDLRKAAQDVVTVWKMHGTVKSLRGWMGILEAVLAQQAEPVQEPVVWEDWWRNHGQHNYRAKPLTSERVRELMKLAFEVGQEATPPRRPPLTDGEIESCRQQGYDHNGLRSLFDFREAARAIERKVRGEKT